MPSNMSWRIGKGSGWKTRKIFRLVRDNRCLVIDVGNKTMMASHPPFDFICLVYLAPSFCALFVSSFISFFLCMRGLVVLRSDEIIFWSYVSLGL